MARHHGSDGDDERRIDPAAVARFFDERASRIAELGPTRAVIYQDKSVDLAERRDRAEKELLVPKLALDGRQRLLDVGCGTGRWVSEVERRVSAYHGVDLTEGLVDFARSRYGGHAKVRFTVSPIEDFSLHSLGEVVGFDRVLCAGVLVYLNDEQIAGALRSIGGVLEGESPLLLFREPVAQVERLTLVEHYSEELESVYNAVYRTRPELLSAFSEAFSERRLGVVGSGYVFADDALNNRVETRQEWFLVGQTS